MLDEHMVYRVREGQTRGTLRRASMRDPILHTCEPSVGTLGAFAQGLRGHMRLGHAVNTTLGDDAEFYKKVGEVFMLFLRARYDHGNPAAPA